MSGAMEAPMWGSDVTRKILTENIALLRVLNEVPKEPEENSLEAQSNQVHRLALNREKEITSNLAFLSATTDESKNVMAVCVQEDENGRGITIRVASNSGDITNIVEGFEKLGRILETAARRENLKAEDKRSLLREIVKFDVSRILSRLRFARAGTNLKTKRKPALIPQLNEALKSISVKAKPGVSPAVLRDLRKRANRLENLFARLGGLPDLDIESDVVQDILMEIVTQSNALRLTSKLAPALRTSMILNPNLMVSLPEAFGKLGRYYTAASELVCAARSRACRVFLTVRVRACQILNPQDHHLTPEMSTSIQYIADRILRSPYVSEKSRHQAKCQLGNSNGQFQERLSEIATYGKIHAEIQLLFFYELNPDLFRPRVICSSKSACYLCNLFFKIHGQFYVPQTHGRVYHRWLLPDWLDGLEAEKRQRLSIIVTNLNEIIENKIREILLTKSWRKYPHPNESCEVMPAYWPSTSVLPSISSSSQSSTSTLRQAVPSEEVAHSISNRDRSIITLEDIAEETHKEDTHQVPPQSNSTRYSSSGTTTPTAENNSTSRSRRRASSTHTTSPRSSHYSHQRQKSPPTPRPYSSPPHNRHHHQHQQQQQHLSLRKPLWHHLHAGSAPLLVSTPSIYATVSPTAMDEEGGGNPAVVEEENRWVELTWLQEGALREGSQEEGEEEKEECGPGGREVVVRLEDLEAGKEVLLTPPVGAVRLCNGRDVLLVRHSLRRPG